MLGWFLDEIVVHFFRRIVRTRRERRSEAWLVAEGRLEQPWPISPLYPMSGVAYTYNVDGHFYSGVDNRPFFAKSSAEDYASRITAAGRVVLRYDPAEPGRSIVWESDQGFRSV